MLKLLSENWQIISGVITVIGGAIAWMWTQKRAVGTDINERVERHIDRIQTELNEVKAENDELTNKNTELQVKNALLEAGKNGVSEIEVICKFVTEFAGLLTCKRRVGPNIFVTVAASRDFARLYLAAPAETYRDKRDLDLFPEPLAAEITARDEEAYLAQDRIAFEERVEQSPSGTTGTFRGFRWHQRTDIGEDLLFCTGEHHYD